MVKWGQVATLGDVLGGELEYEDCNKKLISYMHGNFVLA